MSFDEVMRVIEDALGEWTAPVPPSSSGASLPRRRPDGRAGTWAEAVRVLLMSPLPPGDQIAAEASAWLAGAS